MAETTPQDFWLGHLASASNFNDWVFAGFKDELGESVLEIGCGSGNFTVLIAAHGHRVTALDIHEPYVTTARQRLAAYPDVRVICADAVQQKWTETFDTVVLLDVLEHIENDVSFLKSLAGCLKPGGRLILKVPAAQWLYSPMDQAIGHYRRYNRHSLAKCLSEAGLVPARQSYFNRFGMLGWWLNGKLLKRVTPPAEQLGLFERLVPAFRFIEKVLPLPIGLSLIAVGARPADPAG
jgi:SAM-dependent methyltransferase